MFLSVATLDLGRLRDEVHRALERAGLKVFTQDQSLGAAAGDVLSLLRSHIDKSDFVIHFAGIAYGSALDRPAFADDPSFECSFTQFEYYYAQQRDIPVIAFVCAADFPYQPFTETGADDGERVHHRWLQEKHRERVTKGVFDGTPLHGLSRKASEPLANASSVLSAVAAAIGTIRDESIATRKTVEAAQRELKGLATYHRRLTRRLAILVVASALIVIGAAVAVFWQTRSSRDRRPADAIESADALRYRKDQIVAAARQAIAEDPNRAALLLREIPAFLAGSDEIQMVVDLLSRNSAATLRHPSSRTNPTVAGTPLEPIVVHAAQIEPKLRPLHVVSHSSDENGLREVLSDGSERHWEAGASPLRVFKQSHGHTAVLLEDGTAVVWFRDDRGVRREMRIEGTLIVDMNFPPGDAIVVLAGEDGRIVVRSADPSVADRVWQAPETPRRVVAGRDGKLLVFVQGRAAAWLWIVEAAGNALPFSGLSDNFPISISYPCLWLAAGDRRLLGAGSDGYRLWVAGEGPDARFDPYAGRVTDATVKGGRRAIAVVGDHEAILWDLDRSVEPRVLVHDDARDIAHAWFSDDGRRVFVATRRGALWILRPDRPDPPLLLEGHTGEVRSIAFGPDERWAMTTADDRSARRWEIGTSHPSSQRLSLDRTCGQLALSTDGSRVAARVVAEHDGAARRLQPSPDLRVWRSNLSAPALRIRPLARPPERYDTENEDLGLPDLELSFDALGDRLVVRRGYATQSWSLDWRLLEARLWEIEPCQPSMAERQELLGFPPLAGEDTKPR